MTPTMAFSMLENALDSLNQSVELALGERQNSGRLKVSVLLIAQAVELILKERLSREHWSLIFRRVDNAGTSDAMTVTIDEASKRLERIAGVSLNENDKRKIDELRKTRNRIQHHEVNLAFEQALSQINDGIRFLIDFLHNEFDIDIRDHLDDANYQMLVKVEEMVEELMALARQRIKKFESDNLPRRSSDLAASDYELIDCPECWNETFTFMPSAGHSVCQYCGLEADIVTCDKCYLKFPSGSWALHTEGPGWVLCESCMARIKEE